jgi:hypothetical protein
MELTPVLAGILPTIGKTDLGLDNMVPNPRYLTLSRAMNNARGEAFDFSIRGLDELVVKHDSVMVEACNASFQVHLQLADPDRFAQAYNLAQLLLAPVLASTNSPVLFGRRSGPRRASPSSSRPATSARRACTCASRRGACPSASSGCAETSTRPLQGERRALRAARRHRAGGRRQLRARRGRACRSMKALRLHNGTVYRWNRGCYGISENGKAHLRIELRVLPSGPTIADEVASGALWLGLMSELGATIDDVTQHMDFDHARANLYAAARTVSGRG